MASRGDTEEAARRGRVADDAGHVLGNFPKYAVFHSATERTAIAAPFVEAVVAEWRRARGEETRAMRVLDVGCNSGDLTVAMHDLARSILDPATETIQTTGVDVDAKLVARANALALAAEREVEVRCVAGDAVAFLESQPAAAFDLVTCFSTTMWVHLNAGDEGLHALLANLRRVARVGVIVEPQPWACYTRAMRRVRTTLPPTEPVPWNPADLSVTKEALPLRIHSVLETPTPADPRVFVRSELGRTSWKRDIAGYLAVTQQARTTRRPSSSPLDPS